MGGKLACEQAPSRRNKHSKNSARSAEQVAVPVSSRGACSKARGKFAFQNWLGI